MYDELLKRLRDAAKMSDALAVLLPHSEGNATAKLYNEAADAIEELRAAVEGYEANTNMVFDRSGNNTVIKFEPKWIPVTERLPEHGVHVLAACYVKWLGGGGRYYVCDAFHTEHFKDTCSYSDEIDMEYNEEDDEYYMPEGWWEVIKNWVDCSCVAIGDFVTHWMPFPEPPKEET